MTSTKKALLMVSLLLLAAKLSSPAKCPMAAPSPGPDCSSVLLSMADCLGYVEIGSRESKPNASCCGGLKSVLSVSPLCLCEVLEGSSALGIVLNVTRAVGLADDCCLEAPPVTTLCPGFATPPSALSPSMVPPVPSPQESAAAILTVSSFLLFLLVGVVLAAPL